MSPVRPCRRIRSGGGEERAAAATVSAADGSVE
jgi:hypothetical protein